MSRVAKKPVTIPAGVDVKIQGQSIAVSGKKGTLQLVIHNDVEVSQGESSLQVSLRSPEKCSHAMAGTTRALLSNMVTGVNDGFEKKLTLIGVGYRAQLQGNSLNLTLGFSHPVNYTVPEGINIETPSQTEVIVRGIDKQKVGQVAADIRAYRPPEPYKGKGVRYTDEQVVRKEAKKK